MEDKKALVILIVGLFIGLMLAASSSNTILLLVGWVLLGYCGSGIYFWYKGKQQY